MKRLMAILCLLPLFGWSDDRNELDRTISAAATNQGSAYLAAREVITSLGSKALPYLARVATDPKVTWQQCLVSRICYERIARSNEIQTLRETDWRSYPPICERLQNVPNLQVREDFDLYKELLHSGGGEAVPALVAQYEAYNKREVIGPLEAYPGSHAVTYRGMFEPILSFADSRHADLLEKFIAEFVAKWRKVELKERSAAQEHFLDLCRLVGHPTPAEGDPTGETFCFERGAAKHEGGDGFADVWKRGFFGWEYKGRHKDLQAAYNQLLLYRDALENPPLLVVCDMDRIVVHTNFTSTAAVVHEMRLDHMDDPRNLEILRAVFCAPDKRKPGQTSQAITLQAAEHFAGLAEERTLTKLYNERPAWLATCHARLDAAVAAAYGWPSDLGEDDILDSLLSLNRTG